MFVICSSSNCIRGFCFDISVDYCFSLRCVKSRLFSLFFELQTSFPCENSLLFTAQGQFCLTIAPIMSSEIEAELVNCGEIEAGLVAAMDPPQNDQITETDSEKIPLLDAKPDTSVTELVPPSESVVALDLHEIKPKNESCSPPTSLETTSLSTDSQLNVQPTFATTNESVVQHELVSPQVTPNPAESVSEQPNAKPSPDFPLIQAVVQVAGYLDIAETPATSETSKTFATSKTASVEEMQVDEPIDYDTSPAPPSTVSSPCSSISSRTSKESDCDSTDPTPAPYFSLTEFFTMMRSEHQRLQTFLSNGFQSKHVTPQSLAKAGFFFMLQADRVMCAFCKMTFWGWHEGSNPIRDHFELNPRCRFLNGCDVGNQPIDKGPIELIRDEFGEIDTGGNGSLNDEPQVSTSNDRTTSAIRSVDSRLVTFDSVDEIGDDELSVTLAERLDPIIPSLPKSASDTMLESIEVVTSSETIPADREQLLAMMANEKDRLRTFDIGNWPAFFINPVELARVGFFYTQARDRVECAFCETFIYDWEPGDRPLLEHIRHSPDCPLLKGEAANNVPIDAKAFERVLSIVETITPDFPFDNSPSTTEYDINSELYMHESYESHPEVTSVNSTRPMVDLRFVTFESRKISFDSWPDDSPLDIEAAAAAGFYSLGIWFYAKII